MANGPLYCIRGSWEPSYALQNYCHSSSWSLIYLKSIEYSDADEVKLTGQNSNHNATVLGFDIETTGLSTKERTIEIAIWDFRGGINSCFHTDE